MIEHSLSDRKMKILHAVIQNYLETGEPVGSRTISKYTDLNLSSATIRNEMADLEELGYILQPHTSAGRIPSDKGYRLYVDQLMEEKEREVEERKELLLEKTGKQVATNVDFYSGFVYSMLDLPLELYTPLFAMARIVGWSAHRIEELANNGKIIRPAYKSVAKKKKYVKLDKR